MKWTRLQTTLHMKLLWVVIHWEIIQPFRNHLYKKDKKILSIFKCVDTLQQHAKAIRQSLYLNKEGFTENLKGFYQLFSNNHWLERRKIQNIMAT